MSELLLLLLIVGSLSCLRGVDGRCNIHSGIDYYTCTRYSKVSYSEPYKCGFWYWQRCYKTRYTHGSHHSTCVRNCKVNGAWNSWQAWGEWSSCDRACGRGSQVRYSVRHCNNPTPKNGGHYCPGTNTRKGAKACQIKPCAVNGAWSSWQAWGGWSKCDRACGKGKKVRYSVRHCNNPTPKYGGKDCPGSRRRKGITTCQLKICPVDGGWGKFGPWSKFSECTRSCGGGAMSRHRYRECDNPKPQGGGRLCPGGSMLSDTARCNVDPCKGMSNETTTAQPPVTAPGNGTAVL